MALTPTERNAIADFEAGRALYVSLHTADPSTTGANETTGGGYARISVPYAAATGGTATATAVVVSIPGSTAHTHFGLWSAATAGTFRGGGALSPSVTLGAAGQVSVTVSIPVT